MAGEFEIEREEDGLHVGKYRCECKEPHLDEVRDEFVVRSTFEGLVE